METARRTRALLASLAAGFSLRDSMVAAHVRPSRVVGLMDDPEFRRVACALLDERLKAVA
jgi:hypothetical protein